MYVLIHGVNPTNKGAALLFEEVARRVRIAGHVPVAYEKQFGLRALRKKRVTALIARERFGRFRSLGVDRLPRTLKRFLGVVGERDLGAVLDASGYSLTDAWGIGPAQDRIVKLARWRERGVPYVMLPQAAGPFTDPALRVAVRQVVESTSMVRLRDPQSFAYLGELELANIAEVQIVPDITIALHVEASEQTTGKTLLVPNWNIARRLDPAQGDAYAEALASLVLGLRERGHEVVGLSHEGVRDREILEEVRDRVGNLPILDPGDALECKALIAGSRLVIAGRFHAIVSALAQGVPAVAHSWAHKYQAAMDDFSISGRLADPLDSNSSLSIVDELDVEEEATRIRLAKPSILGQLDEMWLDVFQTVERESAA